MNFLILGGGKVGVTLAALLVDENHDVTIVDKDQKTLQQLQDKLDIKVVTGQASYPQVLEEAGAKYADMLIAVTLDDSTNLLACSVAAAMNHSLVKIARVRNKQYLTANYLFDDSNPTKIAVDLIINPDTAVTEYLNLLIKYPIASTVYNFAAGLVQLSSIKLSTTSPLLGKKVKNLKDILPKNITRMVCISRFSNYQKHKLIMPTGDDVFHLRDEIFFLTEQEQTLEVMYTLAGVEHKPKSKNKIIIGGGRDIGIYLTESLEKNHSIKIITNNLETAIDNAEKLDDGISIYGDVLDKQLLKEENISQTDIFIVVSESDETNIMAGMLAKNMGVKRVVCVVDNISYLELSNQHSIDVVVATEKFTIAQLLHYLRKGKTVKAVPLPGLEGTEALEIIVEKDNLASSKIIDKTISEIKWPKEITLGCIVRNEQILMAHRNLKIQIDDHVIIFVANKKAQPKIYELFNN